MIVRQFLDWARTAPEDARAKAVAALARAYVRPELGAAERAEIDEALPALVADPSPRVQGELAAALCRHPLVPADIALRLARLPGEAGEQMLQHSPVLNMRELIALSASGDALRQEAIARREGLPAPVAALLAEIGDVGVVLALVSNPTADVPGFALGHIVSRFGRVPELREALLSRPDLPAAAHQALIRVVAGALSAFIEERQWLSPPEAARLAREACDQATVTQAAAADFSQTRALVQGLQARGELTSALVLRSLLSGQMRLFLEAVSVLSGIAVDHVAALAADRSGDAFRVLYDRLGLPPGAYIAFRTALGVVQCEAYVDDLDEEPGLRLRILDEVLAAYEEAGESAQGNRIVGMLHRWQTEARERSERQSLAA
ncbi:DUF2336 domain-containing protein [Ancylobacter sp. IITR112]|uniref:DUF2336 domain-containing protein n=1 Tax=Ancylobacter sp. IITR112 TaxID=3138073 RepID=UPI00352B0581